MKVEGEVEVEEGSCRGKLQEEAEEVRGLIISAADCGRLQGLLALQSIDRGDICGLL